MLTGKRLDFCRGKVSSIENKIVLLKYLLSQPILQVLPPLVVHKE